MRAGPAGLRVLDVFREGSAGSVATHEPTGRD